MEPNCPDTLYEIEEEPAIFHRLALDPVDKDYIYLPSDKEVGWTLMLSSVCTKAVNAVELQSWLSSLTVSLNEVHLIYCNALL